MKHHQYPIFFALFLALGLALMFSAPVFADDAPPPEQPAAPEAAAPPAPEGAAGEESGGETEAPAEALAAGATAPLAIAGGDVGILGPPWVFYYVGSTPYEFDQPQDAIDNIQDTGMLPSNRMIYLQQGNFNGFEIDGTELTYLTQKNVLKQLKGVLGNATYAYPPAADFTGYNNEDASVIDSGGVEVHHTTAGFLLQGLSITGGDLLLHDNIGTLTLKSVDVSGSGNEFSVFPHNGAITADSISMTGGEGSSFVNTASSSAGVTITNSAFNGNAFSLGLSIQTNGTVKLSGIDANNNDNHGIYVEAAKGIEVYNTHTADNGGHGIQIASSAAAKVTVNTLQAHNNGDDGLHIETLGDIYLTQVAASNNGLNDDGFGGLGFGINIGDWPNTPGGRNLVGKDLGAWDNHDTGLDLKVSGSATLSGLFTSNNWGTGTYVVAGGAITLNGVNSSNDGAIGVHLVNSHAAKPQAVKILNTYGSNDVNNAQGVYFGFGTAPGVVIQTKGAVSITGLGVNNNVYGGMMIGDLGDIGDPGDPNDDIPPVPAGAVTLTDTGGGGNGEFGIHVFSNNTITWKIGWTGGNGTYGALLDNTGAPSAKAVTVENGWFFGNGGGTGLEVQSNGAVTLKNVNAGDNHGYGIYVNNATGTANVSVTGTSAQWLDLARNGEAGLYIESRGAVTASNISTYENGQVNDYHADGIHIRNVDALTPKTVTASNLDTYNNQNKGVHISSKGAIKVTNISARDNVGEGAFLENTVSGGVKVLRTAYWHNDFSRNGEEGLYIIAMGPVTLARINAYENGWIYYEGWYTGDPFNGVYVDNCRESGGACAGKWAVTLSSATGFNNDFSRNSRDGLSINSGGVVKMSNINAYENGRWGLLVDTNWENAKGAVTISSAGNFQNNLSNNGRDGATIYASGAISITNFRASDNGNRGLNLYNIGEAIPGFKPAAITLTNGEADNNRNGHGIRARSLGNIQLKDVQASNNDMQYGSISFDTTVPEKLTDHAWDWDADSWGEGDVYEFEVDEVGGTLAVEVHAALEFQGVVTLEVWDDVNEEWDFVAECNDVTECTISNASLPNGLYRARITGIDHDNQGNYLVSLNDGPDYGNYDYIGGAGLWLSNDYTGATGTVTVVNGAVHGNVNTHNNGSTGTYIRSRKAVNITSLHSNDNGGRGLDVDNCLWDGMVCLYSVPVTLKGYSSNFSNNQMGGMWIDSASSVSLQNLNASNNHRGRGAEIFAGNLTIKSTNPPYWYNDFSNNGWDGLWLYSTGTVTLDRIWANNNGGQGAWIRNADAAKPKAVKITSASFSGNYGGGEEVAGLYLETQGAVMLKTVQVNDNHGGGAYIDNQGPTKSAITIQQSSFVNNNPDGGPYNPGDPGYSDLFDGIHIQSNSNITWNSSSAGISGSGDGAEILTSGVMKVLAKYSHNDFFNNKQTGLGIINASSVSIDGARGGGNGNRGLGIWTDTTGVIAVNNSLFESNGKQGVLIQNSGSGKITLKTVSAFGNALGTDWGDAAAVEIYTGAEDGFGTVTVTGGTVSILNSAFHHNGDWGIYVDLNGGILMPMIGTTWNSNNWDGAGFDGTDNDNVEIVY